MNDTDHNLGTHAHWGEMQSGSTPAISSAPVTSGISDIREHSTPPQLIKATSASEKLHAFLWGTRPRAVASTLTLVILILGIGLCIHWLKPVPALDTSKPSLSDAAVIEAVKQLVLLPPGVTPTVANVTNLDEVRGDPFFAQAMPGDKVLIYPSLGNAILYSPSRNKIIAFTMIDFSGATSTTTSTASSTP